jgi:UDP:flavonoid glycosyltransferase YjiC (YdhE family)
VHEHGYGVRLATYSFSDAELLAAVDRLLADSPLRARMADVGSAIRARDGLRRGADLIERIGLDRRAGR